MVETTRDSIQQGGADLAAAARDRGIEQLEGAKGHLADGAERVAAAVERTADQLEGDGGDSISGFGRSVASLMRQLAGGLRERDVEEFAHELSSLARRNPGVFLAGSVALGFGIARFFKARAPQTGSHARGSQAVGRWQDSSSEGGREDFDGEESLDLSSSSTAHRDELNGGERFEESSDAEQQEDSPPPATDKEQSHEHDSKR